MSLTLYAHPFASYCWKPLIALYENATPFTYRLVENATGWAELESLFGQSRSFLFSGTATRRSLNPASS